MPASTLLKILIAILVAVLALVAFGYLALRSRARSAGSNESSGGPALRLMFLGLQPGDTSARSPATPHGVWAAAMDLSMAKGSATVISTLDGEASIYFSSGGGILGGVAYDQVQKAARAFVEASEGCFASLTPAPPSPLPRSGHVRFYAHARTGLVQSGEIAEAEVEKPGHALFPCYQAAQEVITQLRLASPKPPQS